MPVDLTKLRRHPFARVPPWMLWLGAAVGIGFFAWNLWHNYMKVVAVRVADAKAWQISGPPCPRIDAATFLDHRYHKGPKRFDYEGVSFFRRYGHVSCAPIYEDGGRSLRFSPVCQFTGPGELLIRTSRGDWYFQPGPGQPATISTRDGKARCVMASKFTMKSVLAEMKGEKAGQ